MLYRELEGLGLSSLQLLTKFCKTLFTSKKKSYERYWSNPHVLSFCSYTSRYANQLFKYKWHFEKREKQVKETSDLPIISVVDRWNPSIQIIGSRYTSIEGIVKKLYVIIRFTLSSQSLFGKECSLITWKPFHLSYVHNVNSS